MRGICKEEDYAFLEKNGHPDAGETDVGLSESQWGEQRGERVSTHMWGLQDYLETLTDGDVSVNVFLFCLVCPSSGLCLVHGSLDQGGDAVAETAS